MSVLSDYFVRSAYLQFDISRKGMVVRSMMNLAPRTSEPEQIVLEGKGFQKTLALRVDGQPQTNSGSPFILKIPASDCYLVGTSVTHEREFQDGVCLMPDNLSDLTYFINDQDRASALVVKISTDPDFTVARTHGEMFDQGIDKDTGRPYSFWHYKTPEGLASVFDLVAGTPEYIETLKTSLAEPATKERLDALLVGIPKLA